MDLDMSQRSLPFFMSGISRDLARLSCILRCEGQTLQWAFQKLDAYWAKVSTSMWRLRQDRWCGNHPFGGRFYICDQIPVKSKGISWMLGQLDIAGFVRAKLNSLLSSSRGISLFRGPGVWFRWDALQVIAKRSQDQRISGVVLDSHRLARNVANTCRGPEIGTSNDASYFEVVDAGGTSISTGLLHSVCAGPRRNERDSDESVTEYIPRVQFSKWHTVCKIYRWLLTKT